MSWASTVAGTRVRVARSLEHGRAARWPTRLLADGWGRVAGAAVRRPLRIPAGVDVVGIGGAVLGGAGKTPVAVEVARALARRGRAVVFVGHGYGARPGAPRIVGCADAPALVGDDALSAALLLARDGVAVVVAPTRQAAVDFAAQRAPRAVLVVDGLLQARPAPVRDAVLVLGGDAPWGAGACPPLGDLRAPREALLEAADHVAVVLEPGAPLPPDAPAGAVVLASHIGGARFADGRAADLCGLGRVGLLASVARPQRLVTSLLAAGVVVSVRLEVPDHGDFSPPVLRRAAEAGVDAWLATARCATKLPPRIGGAPVWTLTHRVDAAPLVERLASAAHVVGSRA